MEVAQNERSHIHENAERVENGVLHDDADVCVNKIYLFIYLFMYLFRSVGVTIIVYKLKPRLQF